MEKNKKKIALSMFINFMVIYFYKKDKGNYAESRNP